MASAADLMGLGMPGPLASAVTDGVSVNVVDGSAEGVKTYQSADNVTDALPTQAEMVAAFGAAATRGAGWVGFIKDNDADTNFFICASNGTSYYALKLTKGA